MSFTLKVMKRTEVIFTGFGFRNRETVSCKCDDPESCRMLDESKHLMTASLEEYQCFECHQRYIKLESNRADANTAILILEFDPEEFDLIDEPATWAVAGRY